MQRIIHKIVEGVTYTDVHFDNKITYCKHVDKRSDSTEHGVYWLLYNYTTKKGMKFTDFVEFKKAFRESAQFKRNRKELGIGTYKTKAGHKVVITGVNQYATACLQGHIHKPNPRSKTGKVKSEYNTWTIHGDFMFTGNHENDLVPVNDKTHYDRDGIAW